MTLTPHGVPHPGLEPLCVISATLSALFATEQSSSVNKAVSLPCCLASSSILLLPSGQFSLLCIFSSRQLLERRFPKIHSRPVWFSRLSTFLFKHVFICIFCHRSFFSCQDAQAISNKFLLCSTSLSERPSSPTLLLWT